MFDLVERSAGAIGSSVLGDMLTDNRTLVEKQSWEGENLEKVPRYNPVLNR